MQYKSRTLQSDPGLSQREALISLQSDPTLAPGTIIAGIRSRNNRWVADILEPKTAGDAPFPPKDDAGPSDEGGDEGPPKLDGPPSDPDSDGDDDSSPSGDSDKDFAGAEDGDSKPKEDKPKGKGGTEDAILHVLTQILQALNGGGVPGGGMGGPDALGPGPSGPPSPPPPKGGPPVGGPPIGGGKAPVPKPMKPGMTPPGGTPVGAPAFASTKEADASFPAVAPPAGTTPVPSGPAGPAGGDLTGAGTCPTCGYPEPCPMHSGVAGAPGAGLPGQVQALSSRAATIVLHSDGDSISEAVAEARPVVEAHGYQVKQAKKGDGKIHILATRR